MAHLGQLLAISGLFWLNLGFLLAHLGPLFARVGPPFDYFDILKPLLGDTDSEDCLWLHATHREIFLQTPQSSDDSTIAGLVAFMGVVAARSYVYA